MEQYYQGFNQKSILPNAERAKYLVLILRISIAISLIHTMVQLSFFLTAETAGASNKAQYFISKGDSWLNIVTGLILPIAFIMWMRRAYANLHRSGLQFLNYSEGWAAGAWFVPFMNLVRPYEIMKEIWYRTQNAFREKEIVPENHSSIKYWWICFVSPLLLVVFVMYLMINRVIGLPGFYGAGILIGLINTFGLLLITKVVRDISGMEMEFSERFAIHQKQELTKMADQYRLDTQIDQGYFFPQADGTIPGSGPVVVTILEGEFTETRERSKVVQVCLWILLPCVLMFGFWACDYALNLQYIPSTPTLRKIFSLLFPITVIAGLVLLLFFLLWINRAYNNLRSLRIENLTIGKGLQQYWWILPIVNLFIPYLMMRDIRQHTQQALNENAKPEPLVAMDLSWMAFILGLLFMWMMVSFTPGDTSFSDDDPLWIFISIGTWVALGFAIVSALFCSIKIRKWEKELFQRVERATSEDDPALYATYTG